MLRKMITISSLVASGLTFAAAAPMMSTQANPFNGFYIGAGLGAANLGFKQRVSILNNNIYQKNVEGSKTGLFEQLNAGYDFAINNWTIGGELFGNLAHIRNAEQFNLFEQLTGYTKLTQESDYGLALRGGYQWHSNLFYLMAGPDLSKFKEKSYVTDGVDSESTSDTKTQAGLLVGGGVEQALTDHLRLREQVTYTIHHGMTFNSPEGAFNSSNQYTSLRSLGAMLGLAYQF